MSTFDDQKADFDNIELDIKEFRERNSGVLGQWEELLAQRRGVVKDMIKEARKLAVADSKSRGMVQIGPFSFQKRNEKYWSLEALMTSEDGKNIIRKRDVVTITAKPVPVNDLTEIKDALDDPEMIVALDTKMLLALVDGKEIILPDGVCTTKPGTPALMKGPKENDYDV